MVSAWIVYDDLSTVADRLCRLHARIVQGALGPAEAQDVERHDASVMNSGEADGGPKPTSQHSPSLQSRKLDIEIADRSLSARIATRSSGKHTTCKWIQYPLDQHHLSRRLSFAGDFVHYLCSAGRTLSLMPIRVLTQIVASMYSALYHKTFAGRGGRDMSQT